jgi:hypothetical protein
MSSGSPSTTSYTFRVLNPDGSVFGRGCFTYEGPPDGVDIQYNMGVSAGGTANKMVAFFYKDPVTEVRDLSNLINFNFTNGWQGAHYRFDFNLWNFPYNSHGMTAGQAQPGRLGPISGHRGAGDVSNQKKLEWPAQAPATLTTEGASTTGKAASSAPAPAQTEAPKATIPAVDLVVVIDSSVSMKDEARALSAAVSGAIEAARTSCPSDLRVAYLGIEGTFKDTKFDKSIREHLTGAGKVKDSALRGRKLGTLKGGGAQEDCARAIEDVALHYDWRKDAARAVFILGDESLEGGNTDGKQDQEDIEAANRSIRVAKEAGVKVHTYYGTSSVKESTKKLITAEYARVAAETGGRAFTAEDSLRGFEELLKTVICGSRPSAPQPAPEPAPQPPAATKPFVCGADFVNGK